MGKQRSIEWVLEQVQADGPDSDVRVVGIDGGGGAGKTTLAGRLEHAAPTAQCVHFDDFYRPSPADATLRDEPCWFFDWRRLRENLLVPLRRGEPGRFRPYDWDAEQLSETTITIEPRGLIIIEGISALRRELRPWIDVGIWVETPADLRLERGVARDGEEARERWVNFWMAEEERYFEAHQPHLFADISVRGDAR